MNEMSIHDLLLKEFERYLREISDARELMQKMSDRLHQAMARYNWVGFYLMEEPGAAARTGKTVVVNNVVADPRYLGADNIKSNIVVPIFANRRVVAELDIESYFADAFPVAEQKFIESCAAIVERFLAKSNTTARR